MVMRISKNRVDLDDKELQRPVLKDYAEAVVTSNSGSSYTIDLEHGNVHDITLTNNCSFTFANPPASGTAGSFKLILTQDGTGGRTVTWPGAVEWVSGSAPTLNSDAGGVSILTFITTDGGTTWYGIETAVVQTSGDTVDRQVFTADGTWNKPSFGTVALIEVWGAGGGDAGGGGEFARLFKTLSDLGSSETVTVGSGGNGSGGDGGESSFGSHVTAQGGLGGDDPDGGDGGGYGGGRGNTGSGPGGNATFGGGGGGYNPGSLNPGGDGGNSTYGGGGGGGKGNGNGVGGSSSHDGGDGGDVGVNGTAPGGGGGDNAAGARGEVRVTVW